MKKRIFFKVLLIFLVMMMVSSVTFGKIDTSGITIDKTYTNQFDDLGSTIISTVRIVGMIISIGALMIIGIRYMTSSVEAKATEKESMIYYCIGAVLLFAIVNIVSAIYEWAANL